MSIDVGKVSIEYLERPMGAAYGFAKRLAEHASCSGDGNAFGFYLREEMEQEANEFLRQMNASPEHSAEVRSWIKGLPWDETGYLALTFNW